MWDVEFRIAVAAALAVVLAPPQVGLSQAPSAASITDRSQVPLLELKPGCWQVAMHTSNTGAVVVQSTAEIRKEWTEKMTSQQIAQMPPGYLDGIVAQIQAGQEKSKEVLEKGGTSGSVACPVNAAALREMETLGFGDARCSRTVEASARALEMHTICPAQNGSPASKYDSDFELSEPEHFRGRISSIPDVSKPQVLTSDVLGKWISEAAPHMPSGVTDLNGKKPIGPQAVAGLDRYRIVATMDGKQVVAGYAWIWINRVPPPIRNGYASNLPDLLQKVYSQLAVGNEAVKLGLTVHEPWRTKLEGLGRDAGHDFGAATDYPGDPNVPPSLVAQWDDLRHHIFYDAYLSQAATDAERQALLEKIKAQYKITVVDRDFFNGQTGP